MKVLFTWHAAVEPEYRKLFTEIIRKRHELIVISPGSWTEGGRLQKIDKLNEFGYRLFALPVFLRDKIKGFFYPNLYTLYQIFYKFKPDIIHIFEEPYSLGVLLQTETEFFTI